MNTTNRDSCRHHFEHVKQTRPFTEREYMQCSKCGHQNPLGLFQHWDTQRDGPAIKWQPRIDFARNSYVYQYDPKIMPKKSAIDYLIEAFKAPFNQKPKRQPIVKVEKHSDWGDGKGAWAWDCRTCAYTGYHPTWATAYQAATHHAHNHHRSQ